MGKGWRAEEGGRRMGSLLTSSVGGKLCRFRPGKFRIP